MPPETSGKKAKGKAKGTAETATTNGNAAHAEEDDSTPHNFNTFVPTHDPSLFTAQASVDPGHTAYALPEPGAIVSQDEAVSRALSAMYWSGYWTAVYHVSTRALVRASVADVCSVSSCR